MQLVSVRDDRRRITRAGARSRLPRNDFECRYIDFKIGTEGGKTNNLTQRTKAAPESTITDPDPARSAPEQKPSATANGEPTQEEISVRAYQCWQERGCPEGSPEADWYKAEQEFRTNVSSGQRAKANVATSG